MASLAFYVAAVAIIRRNPDLIKTVAPNRSADAVRYVFLGITVIGFFMTAFIRNRILTAGIKQTDDIRMRIRRLFTASIVGYALSEAVTILGLCLFILSGKPLDFYLFLSISLLFFFNYVPKYAQWENWVKKKE